MAFRTQDDDEVLADINVTPLVDVMLVLLIIFMIAAPMLHQGVEVDLPESRSKALPIRDQEPLVLTIRQDGLVYLNEAPILPTQLVERLVPVLEARADETILLKGDRGVPYGQVMDILALLESGGIRKVGLVTEPPRQRQ